MNVETVQRNLAQRVLTSALLTGLTVWILFFLPFIYFSLEVVVFITLALLEFLNLLRKENIPVYRVFGLAMGAIIPMVVHIELGGTQSGEVLFLVLACLFLFLLEFFRRNNSQALPGIALTLFGILYISWFLSFLIKIRHLDGGAIWIAYLLSVTKAADIGAYVVGSNFGKHSLIPHISPKKSVEGTLGGILASVLASFAWAHFLPNPFDAVRIFFMGFFIGVIGQIGDLSESLMKRFCNAKDSGSLLPGMGGVLDAVDSILFTVPLFYCFLKISLAG